MKSYLLILFFIFMGISSLSSQAFYFGVDLSYVNEMEHCGAMYNVDGVPQDPYRIFKENGANLVRLRLWHTPSWHDGLNDGMRFSDLQDVMISISRAKAEGMQVLLDFHLSDNWADPSKQIIPAAWGHIADDLTVLQDSLYNYVYNTLESLALAGLLPEMVQIGNETNRGILLTQEVNDSGWVLDWTRNSTLFNAAISAVREIENTYGEEVRIMIHISDPEDVSWFIEQFIAHGVTDFDVIGISYYYQWHGSEIEVVGEIVAELQNAYPEKDVIIAETAYPWTSANADAANNLLSVAYPGFSPHSPDHQLEWLTLLTQAVVDAGGDGIIYWEPGWVSTVCRTQWAQGSSWENAAFFDFDHTLIENGGVKWMTQEYGLPVSVDLYNPPTTNFNIYQQRDAIIIELMDDLSGPVELAVDFYGIAGSLIERQIISPEMPTRWVTKKPMHAHGAILVVVRRKYRAPASSLIIVHENKR